MNATQELLNGPIGQSIGWALLHLLWQGAFVALGLAAVIRLLRGSAANVRYVASSLAMLLMIAIPVATALHVHRSMVAPATGELSAPDVVTPTSARADSILVLKSPEISNTRSESEPFWTVLAPRDRVALALPWIVAGWCLGVLLLTARLSLSWIRLQAMVRRSAVISPRWKNVAGRLARRMGIEQVVSVCESAFVEVPTVIGILRPLVLMPVSAISGLTPDQIETILAHELAHIRRQDYLINILQTIVETLLFYHPAVWWISNQIRVEREHCCDDLAVEVCGDPMIYARALAILEESRAVAPEIALAANGGSLLARIRRLVERRTPGERLPSSLVAGSLGAALLVSFAVIASPLGTRASAPDPAETDYVVDVQSEPDDSSDPILVTEGSWYVTSSGRRVLLSAPTPPLPPEMPAAPAVPLPPSLPEGMTFPVAPLPVLAAAPPVPPTPPSPPMLAAWALAEVDSPLWDEVFADIEIQLDDMDLDLEDLDLEIDLDDFGNEPLDFDELDVDTLIRLKHSGVSRDYAASLEAIGYKGLTLRELTSLSSASIGPDLIVSMNRAAGRTLSVRDLVRMKSVGVSATYAAEMKALGMSGFDSNVLIRLRGIGVTSEYVNAIRGSLGKDLSANDIVRLRGVGVTPEYVSSMRKTFGNGLDARDLIRLRGVGVTPEDASKLRALGHTDIDANDVIRLRGVGADPAYMASMDKAFGRKLDLGDYVRLRGVGVDSVYISGIRGLFESLDAEDVIRLKGVGITPEYVNEWKKSGLTGLEAEDVIRLKGVGVDPAYAASIRKLGLPDADASDLVRLRGVGVTAEYIASLRTAGLKDLSTSDLIRLRGVGVTAEYVRELANAGYDDLTASDLVRMKASGIDSSFIRDMKSRN